MELFMTEVQGFVIMSKETAQGLWADFIAEKEDAFQRGVLVGRADAAEISDEAEADAYDAGYSDGYAEGENQGYNDGVADGYDDGWEDGFEQGRDVEASFGIY